MLRRFAIYSYLISSCASMDVRGTHSLRPTEFCKRSVFLGLRKLGAVVLLNSLLVVSTGWVAYRAGLTSVSRGCASLVPHDSVSPISF